MLRFGEDQHGRRLLAGLVVIALLLLIDAVLVTMAYRANRVAQQTPDAPAASESTSPAASPESAESPSASAEPEGTGAMSERFLAAVGGSAAWRGTRGACGAPGSFEVTDDGGLTWTAAGLELRGPVFALEPNRDGVRGLAVVGDEQCAPVVQRTFTAAIGWEPAPVQQAGSYLDAEGTMVLAGIAQTPPCERPSAVTGAGGGVVLCEGSAHARVTDGSWQQIADGIAAIGPADSGVAIALAESADCPGTEVGVVTGGELRSACAESPVSADIAVSAVGDEVWVWAGERIERVAL